MESAFQFTNPALVGLMFELNHEFNNEKNQEVNFEINFSVSINRSKDLNEAEVALKFNLGKPEVDYPFYIEAIESARFRWEEGMEEGMVEGLLNQNAPSLLLSYLRPVVTQITAASSYGAFNIPFINFSQKK